MRYGKRLMLLVPAAAMLLPAARVRAEENLGVWLGVQLAPVPAALDAHLDLGGIGVMVRNVFVGSPADKAGIDRYEVIVKADGKPVKDGVAGFSGHVQGKKAGDALELTLYRKGSKTQVSVPLEIRTTDWEDLELKHDDEPDVAHRRRFDLRGRILRPSPEGWIWEDLGEIPELEGLYDELRRGLGADKWGPSEEIAEARRVDKDGNVLHVQRQEDGQFIVKRYASEEEEKEAETKTYESFKALKKADPEAAKLLESAGFRAPSLVERWKQGFPHFRQPPVRRLVPPGPRWDEWQERFFQGPLKDLRDKAERFRKTPPRPEADIRFEVNPDGSITVKMHEDGKELTRSFESAEAFEKQAPELYKQFQEMNEKIR